MAVLERRLPALRYNVRFEYTTITLDVPRSDARSRWELYVTDSGWSLGLAAIPRHRAVVIADGTAVDFHDAVSQGLSALRALGVTFDTTVDASG